MKKKKIWLCIAAAVVGLVLIATLVIGIILRKELKMILSIKKITDELYTVDCCVDYKLDDLLNSNVDTVEGLLYWMNENLFREWADVEFAAEAAGCSTFLVRDTENCVLFGRNYDYIPTQTLVIHTAPKDGYEAIGVVDMNMLGIGEEYGTTMDGIVEKLTTVCAPLAITEGLNEKGLGVAILELETEEIHQDKGNPDALLVVLVRAILDRCADVEEAVSLLSQYDVHTFFGYPYHLFIADSTGKSVIAEWVDNEMVVLDGNCCTNFQLAEGTDQGVGIGQERYAIMEKRLAETNATLNREEAMELLHDVIVADQPEWRTEWSCVFNLTDFSFDICINQDYDNVFSIDRNSFK